MADEEIRTLSSIGAIRRSIASILVLPQTPQLEDMTKFRLSRSRKRAAGTRRITSIAFSSAAPVETDHGPDFVQFIGRGDESFS